MTSSVYLDHAATTPVAPEVLEVMLPYFQEFWGNPSSIHRYGRQASEGVEQGRAALAKLLGCTPKEIYFTGGGTEADNLAIFGAALAREEKGRHIITSAVEHHAVAHSCAELQKRGWDVTYLPVDGDGLVDPADVRRAIRPDTVWSPLCMRIMRWACCSPLRKLARFAERRACGVIPMPSRAWGISPPA